MYLSFNRRTLAFVAVLCVGIPAIAQNPSPAAASNGTDDPRFPRTVTVYGINDLPAVAGLTGKTESPGGVVRPAAPIVRLKGSPLAIRALETSRTTTPGGVRR